MKTIYIRTKKSGNFEFSNKEEADLKFRTKKDLFDWFKNKRRGNKLIKATYRLSQIYYNSYEFDTVWKRAKEIYS